MDKKIIESIDRLSSTIFEALDGSQSKGGVKDALFAIATAINRLTDVIEDKPGTFVPKESKDL